MSLTRSFFVRRLVPSDAATYAAEPHNYQGQWAMDSTGEVGEVVDQTPNPVPDGKGGFQMDIVWTILWVKSHTVTFERPTFFELADEDVLEDDEDEEEFEDEEGEEEPKA